MENLLTSLSEQLRPKSFDELVLDRSIKDKIQKMYESQNAVKVK